MTVLADVDSKIWSALTLLLTEYTEGQAFHLVVRIAWVPPPSPADGVAPPPLGPRGETHSPGGGGPNSTMGRKFWYSRYTLIPIRFY
jgi:hypothetical protein